MESERDARPTQADYASVVAKRREANNGRSEGYEIKTRMMQVEEELLH